MTDIRHRSEEVREVRQGSEDVREVRQVLEELKEVRQWSEEVMDVRQRSEEVREVRQGSEEVEEVPRAQEDGMCGHSGSAEDSITEVALAPTTPQPHRAGKSPSHPNLEEGSGPSLQVSFSQSLLPAC